MAMNVAEADRVVREVREHIAAVEEAQECSMEWRVETRQIELAVIVIAPTLDELDVRFLDGVAGRWSWTIRPADGGLKFIIW